METIYNLMAMIGVLVLIAHYAIMLEKKNKDRNGK